MTQKLIEAINVPGAELIGTAKGYDLFNIRTYEAAQQFVVENTRNEAGAAYVQNENTFNTNINENQQLYFFVMENTNHVYAGVVKSATTNSDIDIAGQNGNTTIHANFLFEANHTTTLSRNLPLFLIPGIVIANRQENLIVENGDTLVAVLPQLTPEAIINLDLTTSEITHINHNAFSFNQAINTLILGDNIISLGSGNVFDNVEHIIITWREKPADWPENWSAGYEDKIEYTQAEEIELARQQAEAEARQQAEREAEEARIRAEQEAEAARQRLEQDKREAIANLRYKKEGKGITILGVKRSFSGKVVIPQEIDGSPVTKIAPFAFYHKQNIEAFSLPETLKEIGQGAFAHTNVVNRRVFIPAGCKIGKNAFYHSNISPLLMRGNFK